MLDIYQATLQCAEKVLSGIFHSPVQLSVDKKFDSRHLVLRCSLDTASALAPKYVILKRMDVDTASAQVLHPRVCFLTELASLRFFNGLGVDRLSPRLYGHDRAAGLLVIEDLGPYQTLWEILQGSDARLAEDALINYAQCLGQMHATAVGKESALRTLLANMDEGSLDTGVSVDTLSLPTAASQDIRYAKADLFACLAALGVESPVGFVEAIGNLQAAIHDVSSPFRTWVHSDLRPLNVMVSEDTRVQLIDFELATYGHALLDAVTVRMAFPPPPAPVVSSGRAVPPAVVRRFEEIYRTELVRAIPEVAGDAVFYDALVQASAHWAMVKLLSLWKIHLRERLAQGEVYDDREDIAPHKAAYARFRQQGVAYLRSFVDTSIAYERLPVVRGVAQALIAALQKCFPEIRSLSCFPAFAGEGHR